jgi:hypothetical protein
MSIFNREIKRLFATQRLLNHIIIIIIIIELELN